MTKSVLDKSSEKIKNQKNKGKTRHKTCLPIHIFIRLSFKHPIRVFPGSAASLLLIAWTTPFSHFSECLSSSYAIRLLQVLIWRQTHSGSNITHKGDSNPRLQNAGFLDLKVKDGVQAFSLSICEKCNRRQKGTRDAQPGSEESSQKGFFWV